MTRLRILLAATLSLATACGAGDLVLPNEGQPAKVTRISGDLQTGTILTPAAESLVVQVVDRFGNPVGGVSVSWSAEGGGDVSPASVVTGTDGRAATQRILGAQVGSYGTTAVATPLPDAAVTFTTTAVASRLAFESQPGASASSGQPFNPQPVLRLQDPSGAPLARAGVSVTVQIASGDGTLQGTTSRQSDGDGRVTFTDLAIVGGPGARTLIFAADGYAPAISTPVSLGVGAPASVAGSAGDGQSATVGTAVPIPPAVIVRDAGGTPVAGVPVTFEVASGGGSVGGASATTGADGVATVGRWTLGDAAGPNTLKATVGADNVSGNPVTFTATGTPGAASGSRSSVSVSPASIPASSGTSVSVITIVVRDGDGNPIAGQSVTLSATGGGVSLTQPGVTDASGTTTGQLSATVSGDHAVTAVSSGVTLGTKTITVTAGPAALDRSTVNVPTGTAGVETVVTVQLQDGFGNPVTGAAAQLTMTVAGANPGAKVKIEEAGGGMYRAKYTPTKTGTDQLDLRVAGQPLPGSPFTSAVAAGPADAAHTTADVPDRGSFGARIDIVVHAADAFGNPLGRGGDVVVVTPEGSQPIPVTDQGDGSYLATYVLFAFNRVRVAITINGSPIHGSPFTIQVR
ncbi:MAG TPA: Ig-like domain-containing protein [Gemmatimonadales bacterium]|nr:Ig-like domain-containing protein [Gemmatimonadales bacterium]